MGHQPCRAIGCAGPFLLTSKLSQILEYSHLTNLKADAVIKKLFGVSYDPSQVGRLLKKAGWTRAPERSTKAATEGSSTKPTCRLTMARRNTSGAQKKRRLKSEPSCM
ncbi:winged helix-turn-helix domain-containing protein [Larkinella insperata]|uniref:Winged helix-turn-helix domain-containing protein n=1 Tax=Larkinella insperata TaxID=332158 RepID=A0ABW3QMS0_9BACT